MKLAKVLTAGLMALSFGGFAATASAGSITIGGQHGANVTDNCGTGLHSSFVGVGNPVMELKFDGTNGSSPYSPCPGSGPDANFVNYGPLAPANYFLFGPPFGFAKFTNTAGDGADVVRGRQAGVTGDPWADNTPYIVVPGANNGSNDALKLDLTGLGTQANYFGLYWGSLDTYNHISFTLSDSSVFSFNGGNIATALAALANGEQFQTTSNVFVDFFIGGATINSIVFSSDQRAFEIDNMAFGTVNVPEPMSLALLGFGLAGLGGLRRKAKKA